jgi:hypothetical protein
MAVRRRRHNHLHIPHSILRRVSDATDRNTWPIVGRHVLSTSISGLSNAQTSQVFITITTWSILNIFDSLVNSPGANSRRSERPWMRRVTTVCVSSHPRSSINDVVKWNHDAASK